jgi:arginyl-tRNA synthetase
MKQYLRERILAWLKQAGCPDTIVPTFEKPKIAEHGDLTTNVAMVAAKAVGAQPRRIAQAIVDSLHVDPARIASVEIAGPGFINFRFTTDYYQNSLGSILAAGANFGKVDLGRGLMTQVEFVSANPTGPLTVGHGRGAVFGDTVSRLLEWANYDVTREYYFNNAGRQMRVLGDSVRLRYLEELGKGQPFPEDYYQGEYIREIARHLRAECGDALADEPAEGRFKEQAEKEIFDDIKGTLKRLGVAFDVFYNEHTLYETGKVKDVIEELKRKGLAYEQEGALWFKTTALGLEKDKVIVKSTGEPTYRLPDIAYHREKFRRGFELVIDVLGADHIATYPDVLAALRALGFDDAKVKVLIHQFVTIVQDGEVVKMSTRKANYITLDELIDQVGADVVRYFFLMRGINSHLNFDLKLAKEQSDENPVYYLQYAYARIASIIRHAGSQTAGRNISTNYSLLQEHEELELIKTLMTFPDVVGSCAAAHEPHRLAEFLHDAAGKFHAFYHAHRVVTDNAELMAARMALCEATKHVLANGFSILGISAPEKM